MRMQFFCRYFLSICLNFWLKQKTPPSPPAMGGESPFSCA